MKNLLFTVVLFLFGITANLQAQVVPSLKFGTLIKPATHPVCIGKPLTI